jgi:hypothetical protein
MKRSVVAVLAVHAFAISASAADGLQCSSNTATGTVSCTLPANASSIDLATVVSAAHALNSTIDARATIVLAASGGAGASGDGHGTSKGGALGAGGFARMVTTLSDLSAGYGTTTIHYYLGDQGAGNHPGGKGGASTIVAVADLSTTPPSAANVLLVAGGGGGGGAGGSSLPGYAGGNGGRAISTLGSSAVARGVDGRDGAGSGGGGDSGGFGHGGAGGDAGHGSDAKPGGAGTNGFGGQGGPVHIAHGASTSTGWRNVSGVPAGIG